MPRVVQWPAIGDTVRRAAGSGAALLVEPYGMYRLADHGWNIASCVHPELHPIGYQAVGVRRDDGVERQADCAAGNVLAAICLLADT